MNADRLQAAVHDAHERSILRDQLRANVSEGGMDQLLEFLRAAFVIAAYSIRSAKSGRQDVPARRYGYFMFVLWEEVPPDSREFAGALLPWVKHAYVTLRSFVREGSPEPWDQRLSRGASDWEASVSSARTSMIRVEALLQSMASPDFLRPESDGLGLRRLDAVALEISRSSQYQAAVHARRSGRTWAALESLAATSAARLDLGQFERGSATFWAALGAAVSDPEFDQRFARQAVPPAASVDAKRGEQDDDFAEEEASPSDLNYKVWYGTNRKRATANSRDGFLNERDELGRVHYGTCLVRIPPDHQFGSVGPDWWKRWTFWGSKGRLKLVSIDNLDEMDFCASLREALGAGEERTLLIYVHGYNTSFAEAAIRASQIGYDLKIDGAMAFFSWPSKNQTLAYAADSQALNASETSFKKFVTTLAERVNAQRIHFIVHSMGNRLFARAIRDIAETMNDAGVEIGAVVLAAPDIDVDVFRTLAVTYPNLRANATMYVSSRDRALALSGSLQDFPRAGFTPPITIVDGVDTIDVTGIDVSLLGHAYYAAAAPVLYDMKAVIEGQHDPNRRIRLERVTEPIGVYWAIRT